MMWFIKEGNGLNQVREEVSGLEASSAQRGAKGRAGKGGGGGGGWGGGGEGRGMAGNGGGSGVSRKSKVFLIDSIFVLLLEASQKNSLSLGFPRNPEHQILTGISLLDEGESEV